MFLPLVIGVGAAIVGGVSLIVMGGKGAHTAAVHPGGIGNSPIVVGKPGGPILVPKGLTLPLLTTKPPVDTTPAPQPPPVAIGTSPAGNPLHVIAPVNGDTGQPTQVFNVAVQGKAVPAAHALYDYLVAIGPHTDGSSKFVDLTTAFQAAHNTDEKAVQLSGSKPLKVDGVYDAITSGSLSIYTGHPIPPNPTVPAPKPATVAEITDPNRTTPIKSPIGYSSFNLDSYLKLHKNDKSATLKALVKAFQHDVNTDPTFPGPASFSGIKLISKPLTEDGLYGPSSYEALKILTLDTVKP